MERRGRTRVGAALLAGAGVLAVAAVVVPSGGADMSAPPAVGSIPPATVTPLSTAGSPLPPPPTTLPAGTTPASTTLPLSPAASLVGPPRDVTPPPVASSARPVGVRIEAIGVDDPIVPVGVQADGQLEIPDERHVGWYRLGAAPGQPGAFVLAAHVNWNGIDGPFVALRDLEPGARVTVDLDDGSSRVYEVVERQQYDKAELPAERVWTHDGPETLVLITCGGSFNPDIHRYRHNIVAYALPIGGSP